MPPGPAPLLACTRGGEVPVAGRGTVMDRCLDAGLPVASSCGGRGACGRCVLTLLEGGSALTPAGLQERRVLQRNGQPEGTRLACRCRVLAPARAVRVRAEYW